jgi:hypothetical protein
VFFFFPKCFFFASPCFSALNQPGKTRKGRDKYKSAGTTPCKKKKSRTTDPNRREKNHAIKNYF